MSQYLNKMEVGNFVAMRGPKGKFKYRPNMCRAMGMIAGGTGVTPMFQVARAILENPADRTSISLIFANVTADDILLKLLTPSAVLRPSAPPPFRSPLPLRPSAPLPLRPFSLLQDELEALHK
ncbi:unnamed protein product [Closterium sp. Naga37s-1]|nr:unnamed protein product [Closterium sp. Naga37s-1]